MRFAMKPSLAVLAVIALISLTTYSAHAEIYLKTSSLQGDAMAPGFQNDIAISSIHFGARKDLSIQSGIIQSSKPVLSVISLGKISDRSSTGIINDILEGKSLPTVDL